MVLNNKKRLRKKEDSEYVDLEPKLKKPVLFMLSSKHNKETKQLLKNLYQISKDNAVFRVNNSNKLEWQEHNLKLTINQKNHRLAESICDRMSCGLYVTANSNKKRPISFGFGRIYNRSILDCCQLKVEKFVPMEEFKYELDKVDLNSRPLIVAQGSEFSQDFGPLKTLRNIMFDVFRGPSLSKISLQNVKQVIVLSLLDEHTTATLNGTDSLLNGTLSTKTDSLTNHLNHVDDNSGEKEEAEQKSVVFEKPRKLLFRRYSISLSKSGTSTQSDDNLKLPNVKLNEIGPSIDFLVEEVMEPDMKAFKSATKSLKKPKKLVAGEELMDKKVSTKRKNVKTTGLGHKEGKVYLNRQDLDDLYTPHSKKMKKHSQD